MPSIYLTACCRSGQCERERCLLLGVYDSFRLWEGMEGPGEAEQRREGREEREEMDVYLALQTGRGGGLIFDFSPHQTYDRYTTILN